MPDNATHKRSDRRRRQRLDKRHVLGLPQSRFVERMLDSPRDAYDQRRRAERDRDKQRRRERLAQKKSA